MKRIIALVLMLTLLASCTPQNNEASSYGEVVSTDNNMHVHTWETTDNTVSDKIHATCGNVRSTIHFDKDTFYSFMYTESLTLHEMLTNLNYDSHKLCKCLSEYQIEIDTKSYEVNLSESYARSDEGQVQLTAQQTKTLKEIIDWARDKAVNRREIDFEGFWLNKETAQKYDDNIFSDIRITKIYKNCFFANTVIPMPYEIKLNGTLSDEWCVGDKVKVTYENTYYDDDLKRAEADMLTIRESDTVDGETLCAKPVIYLYPETKTEVAVKLNLNGELTCTYPKYANGWRVTATPDGTLTDETGKEYNYLYWEGETDEEFDFSEGFCVKGEDTAEFLETALESLGLNRREANEFIVYWLPLMETNPYNIIAFQGEEYTNTAKLEITPTPDTVIRVFMAYTPSDTFVKIPPQNLTSPTRNGLTVVEWGGTKVK